ncbi:hypothetical protein E2C01_084381 [Portunus trituberculatus]|uniref:Uncharacterized protein n=1 Tax=Portunus trituberculatus TaxID=210409 RepID=A0A5B7J3W9_PORTR|nr:hypothetical protein [Portunus trituberculatus]
MTTLYYTTCLITLVSPPTTTITTTTNVTFQKCSSAFTSLRPPWSHCHFLCQLPESHSGARTAIIHQRSRAGIQLRVTARCWRYGW